MIGVYIIQSQKNKKFYTGSSNDIDRRIYEHNHSAGGQYSKINGPWKLVWFKEFEKIEEARLEEKRIKSFKGGNAFKKLLN